MDKDNALYCNVCGLYIDQNKHMSRIMAAYPNGQFGVFEMPIRNGLPKLDATPRLIYHNAPSAMCAAPYGYALKFVSEVNTDFMESLKQRIIGFLATNNMLDSCNLEPTPYIFNSVGYRHVAHKGIDQRWFVSLCDGFSFMNAEFRVYNPHPTGGTPWVVSDVYTVLDFYKAENGYMLSKGMSEFQRDCQRHGYTEMQKPYGLISNYVDEALKNWKPPYREMTFPESLNYEPFFVSGLRYNMLHLRSTDLMENGNIVHYYALLDDNQTLHKFADWKLGAWD